MCNINRYIKEISMSKCSLGLGESKQLCMSIDAMFLRAAAGMGIYSASTNFHNDFQKITTYT